MARIANSLGTLRSQYNTKYPSRSKASDGWIGDAAHTARTSDHNPNAAGVVCALDVTHDPSKGLDCNVESEKVIKDTRVNYVIWNRRIRYYGGKWQAYGGTNPHMQHMHVSVSQTSSKYDDSREWNLTTPQGGNAVNDKFTNEAEVKPFYMVLRGNEATLAERQGWVGKPKIDFITSTNSATEARNNATERNDLKKRVSALESELTTAKAQLQDHANTPTVDPVAAEKAKKYDIIKEALK